MGNGINTHDNSREAETSGSDGIRSYNLRIPEKLFLEIQNVAKEKGVSFLSYTGLTM